MEELREEQRELNRRSDWRHRAACIGEDPELFFPTGTSGPARMQIAEAKKVCRRCEVRETCLQWALDNHVSHGVWGGRSEDERDVLKKRLAARAALQSESHDKIA